MTAHQIAKTDFTAFLAPARNRFRTYMPASQPTLLLVTGGFHAGASLDLENDSYTLGSDVNSDIVLADPGIAARHVVLRRRGRQIEIEAIGGDVRVDDTEILEGHGRRCRLPAQLQVGDATLRLEGPERTLPFDIPELPRSAKIGGAALLAVIGVFAISFAANGVALPQAEAEQTASISPALQPTLAAPAPEVSQPVIELKARMAEAGLTSLQVAETEGRLLVSGILPGEKSAAWSDIHAWFDRSFGTQTVLTSKVEAQAAEAMPRLKLRAIFFGDRPYVISSDGARFYEGAFTKDGWTVADIGEKQLLLTKGSAQIALTYP